MEPLFRSLVVGLVPQPTQVPPTPFDRESLQRIFIDVSRSYPYAQFGFLPADQGAQFLNPPEDRVMVQPGLIQVAAPLESTAERGREKAVAVLRVIAERLSLHNFVVCGIKVVAHVPAPEEGAREFVQSRLMSGQTDHLAELGEGFFGGGVKFRRFDLERPQETVLLVEPLVNDDTFIFVDYDHQRAMPFIEVDPIGSWIDEAFDFVRGPVMAILKEA
jgi:hypothetical protein